MKPDYTVNVVVTTFNRIKHTKHCIESLLSHRDTPFEITVVDNASQDGTRDYLETLRSKGAIERLFLMKRNMGVAVASNLGWAATDCDCYIKLDNDITVHATDWLANLIDVLEDNREVGAAGYQFCDWHTTEQITLSNGQPFLKFDGLGGACVAIPRRTRDVFGYWNEDYGIYGFEDLDYGARMLHKNVLSGYSVDTGAAVHHGDDAYEDETMEDRKTMQTTSKASGQALYLLNKFLFEHAIRPIRVDRKYLPRIEDGQYAFRMDESYGCVVRLHNALKRHFSFTIENDQVSIDIAKLKQGLHAAMGQG